MKSTDKEEAMSAFRDGLIDVLVATTVIEVGIDVPNATVMVIEDADRFGLSQLHQLRVRVGRGLHPGHCLLLADAITEDGEQRLLAMVATNDGFELANTDLRLRGQGTVFGTKQSGLTDLKLANVVDDEKILIKARRDAFDLIKRDPDLEDHPELAEEIRAMLGERAEWLFLS
jgi:ATP-dependent DNA helicase RecG